MQIIKVPDQFTPKGHVVVRGYRAGAIAAAAPLAAKIMRWRRELPQHAGEAKLEIGRAIAAFEHQLERVFESYSLGLMSATDDVTP